MAVTLNSVPTELLQDIANTISRRDLLQLRKVNREVAAKVDDVFVERFFTTRRHLVTKHSLEKLAEMTAIPRLNRKMKKLEIVVTSIIDYHWVKPADSPPRTKRDGSLTTSSPPPKKGTVKAKKTNTTEAEAYLEVLRTWAEKKLIYANWHRECNSLSGGTDIAMLSSTFRNLQRSKIALDSLEITNDFRGAFGVRTLMNCLGIGVGKNKDSYETYFARFNHYNTVPLVLRSLAATQYAIPRLCLGTEVTTSLFANFDLDDNEVDRLQTSFAAVKSLTLGFSHLQESSDGTSNDEHGLSCLARLLKAANHLRKISLNFEEDSYYGSPTALPATVLQMFDDNTLNKVELFGGSYLHGDLCDFFQHHKDTLTELDLSTIDMPSIAGWRLVFKALASHENLGYLSLESLSQNGDFLEGWGWQKGTEVVQEWMEYLAQTAKFNSPDEELYDTGSG